MSFAKLLEEVDRKIDGLERIRFMTSHPKDLSDELIEVMAKSKKICQHLHLPLQSGSSRILKIMTSNTKDLSGAGGETPRSWDISKRYHSASPSAPSVREGDPGFYGRS